MTGARLAVGAIGVIVWVLSVPVIAQVTRGADLVLVTQPEAGRAVAKDLPRLVHAATHRARTWQRDAIPVSIDFDYRDAPNPSMRGPAVVILFVSPSAGTGLRATVTPQGLQTSPVNQQVRWGTRSLPVLFVDLPDVVRIARQSGLTSGPISRASLRVWPPSGAPPVAAWTIGNRTVNAATGDIITFDVTGHVASYNAGRPPRSKLSSGARSLVAAPTSTTTRGRKCSPTIAMVFVPTGGKVEGIFPGVTCQ
jgi:hypothetical protein